MVKKRQLERTDPAVLAKYGGGDVWLLAAAWDLGEIAPNGNYLENDDIAVSHGVCGDTPQVRAMAFMVVLWECNSSESVAGLGHVSSSKSLETNVNLGVAGG